MNNTMYIFDVYIFPKYRRKGIGIYLVKRAVEIAEKNNNTTRICLYTRTEELSNFYSKNGFLRVKRLEVNGQYLYLHERMKVI
jgi:GNAT superfamily N-acetyltransferase